MEAQEEGGGGKDRGYHFNKWRHVFFKLSLPQKQQVCYVKQNPECTSDRDKKLGHIRATLHKLTHRTLSLYSSFGSQHFLLGSN